MYEATFVLNSADLIVFRSSLGLKISMNDLVTAHFT
jgi:hypothetical protein